MLIACMLKLSEKRSWTINWTTLYPIFWNTACTEADLCCNTVASYIFTSYECAEQVSMT